MTPFDGEILLVARVLFAAVFVYNGYNNIVDEGMVQYADAHDVPTPTVMTRIAGVLILLGGLGILLGAFRVLSALALVAFLVFASPMIHDYWTYPEEERPGQFNHFMKNVAMIGGALAFLLLADGPWPYALNVGLF